MKTKTGKRKAKVPFAEPRPMPEPKNDREGGPLLRDPVTHRLGVYQGQRV